jgi:hypothetical protein
LSITAVGTLDKPPTKAQTLPVPIVGYTLLAAVNFNQMGFLTNLISATVKTALTPVAIVKDVVDVATGNEPENTKKLLKSAAKDAEKAGDTMMGENNDGLL